MGKTTRLISGVAAVSLSAAAFAGSASATPDDRNSINDGGSQGSYAALRIAGLTRYDSAVEASKSAARAGAVKTGGTVYIAGGNAFADSLAVTPLADCKDAPVLLSPASGMSAATMNYLKAIKPAKIVVLGGPMSVDAKFESTVVASGIAARQNVERVAGVTRYETAYKMAAETLACEGVPSGISAAKAALQKSTFAEADYQTALTNWNTARANVVKADNAVATAQDKVDALVMQLSGLAAKLQNVADVETQRALVKTLTNQYAADQAKVDAAASALNVFVNLLGAQPGQGTTTLNINSTLDEYIAKFPGQAAAIKGAAAEVGIPTSTTLNDAITAAKAHLAAQGTTMEETAAKLAQAQADIMAAAAALAANQPILEQMAGVQNQITAAKVVLANAIAVQTQANIDLANATTALATATTQRPAPNQIAKDQAALAKAYDATVADPRSGSHPVFLATGLSANNALAAGPAAANNAKFSGNLNAGGVVLLSNGSTLDAWGKKYIQLSKAQVVAVGAPASAAAGTNTTRKFNSTDDYAVAEAVTKTYFTNVGTPVAVASGEQFADSVIASSYISQFDGGLVLAKKSGLPAPSFNYLAYDLESGSAKSDVRAIGGPMWITDQVIKDIEKAATL